MSHLKRIGLFFICLFAVQSSFGQLEFKNHNLTDQQYKLVYAGCTNKIIIHGLEDVEFTALTASASTVTQVDDSTFILKPRYRSHMDTLKFYVNNEFVQKELFLVMHPPVAKIQLGEIESDFATVETILANGYLNLIEGGFYKDYEKLVRFQLKVLDVDGKEIKVFNKTEGNVLTRGQLEYIKNLKPGNQLEFSDIQVRSSSGITRRKPVLKIQVE